MASGTPIWLGFAGPAGSGDISQAYYGTPDIVLLTENGNQSNGLAPVYTCDPRVGGTKVGEKLFDINCIGFPAFGEVGEVLPPYDLRTPTRSNHDITLFKNFAIHGDQKIQFRMGVFNIFNRAFATTAVTRSDLDLTLETDVQPHGRTACRTASAGRWTACATRPAGSASRRTPSTTSARSTSCAAAGSSSSR